MKKGCYVPVGRCPTAGLRCRVGRFWTSATGRQHPSRRRDAGTAAAVTERATCQRPAQSRVPPPSLMAQLPSGERPAPTRTGQVRTKGGTRLGRLDRKARRKPPWHRRCHQGSRLPPRSALNGAHRAPAPPGEGPPPKKCPTGTFLASPALADATKTRRALPYNPPAFFRRKLGKELYPPTTLR